eukprot:sb/3466439/
MRRRKQQRLLIYHQIRYSWSLTTIPSCQVGIDGRLVDGGGTPRVKGYTFCATPRIEPGVDASPLMTWGEVESTPLRAEGSGTTPARNPSASPAFRIPQVPTNDRLGLAMAERMNKKHKERHSKAMTAMRKIVNSSGITPSPGRSPASRRIAALAGASTSKRSIFSKTPTPQGRETPSSSRGGTPAIASFWRRHPDLNLSGNALTQTTVLSWYRRHLTLCLGRRATFARAGKGLLRYQSSFALFERKMIIGSRSGQCSDKSKLLWLVLVLVVVIPVFTCQANALTAFSCDAKAEARPLSSPCQSCLAPQTDSELSEHWLWHERARTLLCSNRTPFYKICV